MNSYDPNTDKRIFAGVSALTVLTWYALPDAVRSRRARIAIKAGLLGVTAMGVAKIPEVFPEVHKPAAKPKVDVPAPVVGLVALGWVAAGTAATVAAEKFIFAIGERRRASGVRCAHTPAAVIMAGLSGAATFLDWEKIIGVTHRR